MITAAKLAADRRNAQKSTGPRTPQGKAAVRLNALKHGLTAKHAPIPPEEIAEFHALLGEFQPYYRPQPRRYHHSSRYSSLPSAKITKQSHPGPERTAPAPCSATL